MDNPETSIIIRTRNEERWIGETLKRLYAQTYKNFEVVIVDSGSTDATLSIAQKYPVKVIVIAPGDFTYPHALNVGARNANATSYLVLLSAHSLPVSNEWLACGVGHMMADEKVMGVYGPLKALPDGTFWDHLFHGLSFASDLLRSMPRGWRRVEKNGMGVMGFTNAMVRKKLWEHHIFDERFAGGGEDGEWTRHWLTRGYYAIKAVGFAVHHSHYLGLFQWKAQATHWAGLSVPTSFKRLSYRNDGAHAPH